MLVFFSIAIAQTLFSILLIRKKQELILADKILMILLLVFGGEFIYSLLNFMYLPQMPDMIIFPFLIGPLLYIYTFLISSENEVLPRRYIVHFIPFIGFLLLALIISDIRLNNTGSPASEYHPGGLLIVNFLSFALQSLFYWLLIRRRIYLHNKNVQDKLSFASDTLSLNWINLVSLFVFWGFVIFFVIDVFFFFWGYALFESSILLHIGMLMAVYSISFFGFRQEAIFEGQQFERFKHVADLPLEHSTNDDDELNRVLDYLKEEKPYLIRNLALQDLANSLRMPVYRLSEIINKQLNKNFFTLINELRVEEAKGRIISSEYRNLTLTAIGFDSGFNSKSSFHELFKKYTGLTPAQYKKQKQL
ncbi:MAG: helix-turn-helix domain-containing protein [Prolixibacteraceae bacterium]